MGLAQALCEICHVCIRVAPCVVFESNDRDYKAAWLCERGGGAGPLRTSQHVGTRAGPLRRRWIAAQHAVARRCVNLAVLVC